MALVETAFDRAARGPIGEQQMLGDLLDGPFVRVGNGVELGLLGIEGL